MEINWILYQHTHDKIDVLAFSDWGPKQNYAHRHIYDRCMLLNIIYLSKRLEDKTAG